MFRKIVGWGLDYVYITRWTIQGFFLRGDPMQFLHPTQKQKVSIVLIPGVYENWQLLRPIAQRLYDEGYSVHILEGLGYNTGHIPKMAGIVNDYIVTQDLSDVIVVAHSKGGLIAKYALSEFDLAGRVRHIIALNSPFSGSLYAYLFILPSIRTFAPSHKIIKQLAANHIVNAQITSVYSRFDPHIPRTSYLADAENIELPLIGHFRPIGNQLTHNVIVDIIKRN